MKDNWETDEVITHLINDEDAYADLLGANAETIKTYVNKGNAPAALYDSFEAPPRSSFDEVNWEAVAESLAD